MLKNKTMKVIYSWSFDPFTKWHKDILERALDKFDQVIVWVGQNPDKKYMFSFPERVKMIEWAMNYKLDEKLNLEITAFSGLLVDFAFEQWVKTIIRWIRWSGDLESESLLHWVWESQKLWIDTVFLLSKQDQTHISSSATKSILKEQWLIHDYITPGVKHFLEARMKEQYIIWLTGTIWAGKSYITQSFVDLWKEYDIPVHDIDLDKIGHWILGEAKEEWYKKVRKELINIFGSSIKQEDWFINRKALAAIVFGNKEKMNELDKIMYNPLLLKIRKEMMWKNWIILLNWALLAEKELLHFANNNTILIWVNPKIQKERLKGRWHDEDEIKRRIWSQLSTLEKKEIISNKIKSLWYWNLIEIENNWNNEKQIRETFNKIICSVDIFGELRIKSLLSKLGIKNEKNSIFKEVKALYDTPDRLYHNWFHIINCLNGLYEIKEDINDYDFIVLFFAIIFHDVIYTSTALKWENEKNSADFADKIMQELWVENTIIENVKKLILTTSDHKNNSSSLSEKYLIDIDLSILGQNWNIYYWTSKSIRHEYSCYSREEFVKWRLLFLKEMFKRNIFQTDYFIQKYEKKAKSNIEREINLLEKEI